jgi:hypothetical protein
VIPTARDAYVLARAYAGKDVTDAEIQAMTDRCCVSIACILHRSAEDNMDLGNLLFSIKREYLLEALLKAADIDPGPFMEVILHVDPTKPFIE